MNFTSNTDLNFYKTERLNKNKANKLISFNEEKDDILNLNLTTKIKQEDILIPTEVETYLNVKKQYILYKYKSYSLLMIGKM